MRYSEEKVNAPSVTVYLYPYFLGIENKTKSPRRGRSCGAEVN